MATGSWAFSKSKGTWEVKVQNFTHVIMHAVFPRNQCYQVQLTLLWVSNKAQTPIGNIRLPHFQWTCPLNLWHFEREGRAVATVIASNHSSCRQFFLELP